MNILVMAWRDPSHPRSGGAEVYTARVAEEWARRGHVVTVFSAATPAPAYEVVDGVTYVRRGTTFSVYREARRFYEEHPPSTFDLVVDEINTRPFLTPVFVRDARVVALIFQVAREVWAEELPAPAALVGRYVLEPWWLRRYRNTPILTISESSRRSLAHYGLENVELLPVGLDPPPPTSGRKEDDFTAIFVGRLAPNKRPVHALEAMRLVRRDHPEARLWIVGTGPQEAQLRALVGGRDELFGRVPDAEKFELMSRAHVLLATSTREGWGMTVTEAAAVRTPTIAYRVPGLVDSVAATGGRLVDPEPGALASAVLEAARSPQALVPASCASPSWGEVAEVMLERAVALTSP